VKAFARAPAQPATLDRPKTPSGQAEALLDVALQDEVDLVVPPLGLCSDNGAMIAWAGAERLAHGLCDTLDTAPRARWPLEEIAKPAVSVVPAAEPEAPTIVEASEAATAGAEPAPAETAAPAPPSPSPPASPPE